MKKIPANTVLREFLHAQDGDHEGYLLSVVMACKLRSLLMFWRNLLPPSIALKMIFFIITFCGLAYSGKCVVKVLQG
jgi:hypothetical protein